MKEYPSILGASEAPQLSCLAFKKYDGSNLRFAWQRRRGWCQFGTRRRMFDAHDPEYGCAIHIFQRKYAVAIERIIETHPHFRGVEEIICYGEFFGPQSFAGVHAPDHPALAMKGITHNEPKDVVLFDVNVHKKGFLTPKDFVSIFGQLPIAEVVFAGDLTPSFITDVREGRYPVTEGVVCKGCEGKPPHGIWMRKIKTLAYLQELKVRFASEWERYWE